MADARVKVAMEIIATTSLMNDERLRAAQVLATFALADALLALAEALKTDG